MVRCRLGAGRSSPAGLNESQGSAAVGSPEVH